MIDRQDTDFERRKDSGIAGRRAVGRWKKKNKVRYQHIKRAVIVWRRPQKTRVLNERPLLGAEREREGGNRTKEENERVKDVSTERQTDRGKKMPRTKRK